MLERCLQKDPKQRLHDIGDVRLALDGAFETSAAAPASSRGRRGWGWPVGAAGVALAAAGLTWSLSRPASEPVSPKRFSLVLPAGDRLPLAFGTMVAISPDGQTLVYRGARDGIRMFLRRIHQFDATVIGDPAAATHRSFRPTGNGLPM